MNLKQLQFTLLVAETRSFSRAAELAFATQPTLSNAISQLEEELGGRLFTRTTRKVELTPFGESLLPFIQRVAQSRDDLVEAAQQLLNPTHKLLRIGFSPLVDMQRLDRALQPFRQQHPDVHIYFKECFIDDLATRLQHGQIDVQIVAARDLQPGEECLTFYRDPLYYLPAATDNANPGQLTYDIAVLPDTPLILTGGGCGLNDALATLFGDQDARFNAYAGQALSYKVIEEWCSLGIGAGILPRSKLTAGNNAARPLQIDQNAPAVFDFQWIWQTRHPLSDTMQAFLQHIETAVPALMAGAANH